MFNAVCVCVCVCVWSKCYCRCTQSALVWQVLAWLERFWWRRSLKLNTCAPCKCNHPATQQQTLLWRPTVSVADSPLIVFKYSVAHHYFCYTRTILWRVVTRTSRVLLVNCSDTAARRKICDCCMRSIQVVIIIAIIIITDVVVVII